MAKSDIKRFLIRFLLFASPFLLIILSFVIIDPFKIIFTYANYSGAFVTLNPDYISTETYLKNRDEHHFDSFIFGSSKTLAYRSNDWKTYLNGGTPFIYHSSSESLFGIYNKIKFISEKKDPIKNAILIIDRSVLEVTTNSNSHLYIKHPAISHESWLSFYCTYLRDYFLKFFFVRCVDFAIFHKYRPYMEGYIDQGNTEYDPITNDMTPKGLISEREKNIEKYSEKLAAVLPTRDTIQKFEKKIIIGPKQEQMLTEIVEIFKKENSNYKIVLSPNYDQIKLNSADTKKLETIFGRKNIYDFSGINKYTNDVHNYYEASHYTIDVGKNILKEIYTVTETGNN